MKKFRLKRVESSLFVAFSIFCLLIFLETKYFHDGRFAEMKRRNQVRLSNNVRNNETSFVQAHLEDNERLVSINNITFADINDFNETSRRKCSRNPQSLKGRIAVTLSGTNISGFSTNKIRSGGWWQPYHCKPRVRVAILIPYRNRPEQLRVFLSHMHPVFQRQLLSYRIFVIEQLGKVKFNKGAIYNIGFNETLRYDDYDCYIFHDVDLLSENDKNYYGCPTSPRHMSVAIDKFNYRLPYQNLFGGIQAFDKYHYIFINGYSNKYWGWGAEDDDLFKRISAKGFKLTRPSNEIGRYVMNQHQHYRSDSWNRQNIRQFHQPLKPNDDGLNSIKSLKHTVFAQNKPLYTLVSIDILEQK